MKTLDAVIAGLPAHERAAIEERAAALIGEELTLKELRKALDLTQETVAEALRVKQVNVSQMEKRSDLLLSTLRRYVEAMGGELDIVARFPGRPIVKIAGLSDIRN